MEAAPVFAKANPELIETRNGKPWVLEGTEFDHKDAWRLVNSGFAEAVDEECLKKCEENPATDEQKKGRSLHERLVSEQREFYEDRKYYLDDEDNDE